MDIPLGNRFRIQSLTLKKKQKKGRNKEWETYKKISVWMLCSIKLLLNTSTSCFLLFSADNLMHCLLIVCFWQLVRRILQWISCWRRLMMLKQGRACLTFKRTIFVFNFYGEKLNSKMLQSLRVHLISHLWMIGNFSYRTLLPLCCYLLCSRMDHLISRPLTGMLLVYSLYPAFWIKIVFFF